MAEKTEELKHGFKGLVESFRKCDRKDVEAFNNLPQLPTLEDRVKFIEQRLFSTSNVLAMALDLLVENSDIENEGGSDEKKSDLPRPWGFDDLMVVSAFRYCCGRSTYIVGVCANWLIEQWPNFADNVKGLIKKELEEQFRLDDSARESIAQGLWHSHKPLGDDCDRAEWERVRTLWGIRDEQRG